MITQRQIRWERKRRLANQTLADVTGRVVVAQLGQVSALAAMLKLDSNRVNIKAKTAEGLGPVGSGEAVTAQVAVLLELAK